VAVELVGGLAEVGQAFRRRRHVDLRRLENRLAVVERLDAAEFLGAGEEELGRLLEDPAALAGLHRGPGARLEGLPRAGHGAVEVLAPSLRDFGDRLAGCRVGRGELLSGRGRNEFAPDEEAGLEVESGFGRHSSKVIRGRDRPVGRKRQAPPRRHGADGAYLPLNFGTRFSWLAAMPSLASSLWKRSCWSSRSTASADSTGRSHPDWTERLIRPTAFAALWGGTNCRA